MVIVIRRAEDMVKEVREKMRGGEGTVELLHIFRKDELKARPPVCQDHLAAGCSIVFHNHDDEEELFYILRGTGTVNDDGKEAVVRTGDAILTGDGAGHEIANTGDEPLEIMATILLY